MRSPWNNFLEYFVVRIGVVEAYAESVCVQVPHGVCASILISTDNPCELANQPWHSPQ